MKKIILSVFFCMGMIVPRGNAQDRFTSFDEFLVYAGISNTLFINHDTTGLVFGGNPKIRTGIDLEKKLGKTGFILDASFTAQASKSPIGILLMQLDYRKNNLLIELGHGASLSATLLPKPNSMGDQGGFLSNNLLPKAKLGGNIWLYPTKSRIAVGGYLTSGKYFEIQTLLGRDSIGRKNIDISTAGWYTPSLKEGGGTIKIETSTLFLFRLTATNNSFAATLRFPVHEEKGLYFFVDQIVNRDKTFYSEIGPLFLYNTKFGDGFIGMSVFMDYKNNPEQSLVPSFALFMGHSIEWGKAKK